MDSIRDLELSPDRNRDERLAGSMGPEELKTVLRSRGVDLWALIDAAIALAARDHGPELRARRDAIVGRLFSPDPAVSCRNCAFKEESSPERKRSGSSWTPMSEAEEEEDEEVPELLEDHGRPIDYEQHRILDIKERIEDPEQPEETLVSLLRRLAAMDVTFKALKETDIGRNVNALRKHPSGEVRRFVKLLVRRWKNLVDEWVKSTSETASPAIINDGDSPQQVAGKTSQNGHQVLDFDYYPNLHNGALGSETESTEKIIPRKEAPPKTNQPPQTATPARLTKDPKDSMIDPEKLASARKRLQQNYREVQHAKLQRTIQVMDISDIPKPKNSFFPRNKGGSHGKHW